jgi:hypothetical protein
MLPVPATLQKRLQRSVDLGHLFVELLVPLALPAGILDAQPDRPAEDILGLGLVCPQFRHLAVVERYGLMVASHHDFVVRHDAVVLFQPFLVVHHSIPNFAATFDIRLSSSIMPRDKMTIMLTDRPSYQALEAHYRQIHQRHLRDLFAEDPARGERMSAEAAGLYLNYAKNRITDETLRWRKSADCGSASTRCSGETGSTRPRSEACCTPRCARRGANR